jgi:SAM-dependent methyltransferase
MAKCTSEQLSDVHMTLSDRGPRRRRRPSDRRSARQYWQGVHRSDALHPLQAVCVHDAPLWFNRHVDRVQRRAFGRALPYCGPVAGARALDLGCGRGRWSSVLAELGADIVGIDVSEEAIRAARDRVRGGAFYVADIVAAGLRHSTFDLIVSVTVLQHLGSGAQVRTLEQLAHLLKTNGRLLLLENIRDQGPHIFSRSIGGWTRLAGDFGLRRLYVAGYAYDIPVRFIQAGIKVAGRIGHLTTSREQAEQMKPPTGDPRAVAPTGRGYRYLLYRPVLGTSVLLEGPAETLLPDQWATHAAMVFVKP